MSDQIGSFWGPTAQANASGLDGVAFLRFLRLLRWVFVAASILAGGALL